MSNRHQELASPKQMASGKDFSNPLMADSLPKTIWVVLPYTFRGETEILKASPENAILRRKTQRTERLTCVLIEVEEDDDPNDITDIFKIEGNLFDYETPLCKAFNNFNHLLKIDTDLFTFNIHGIRTYEEYELNNTVTRNLEELWSDNGVSYQLCEHICEPYRFKNGITKWPTCSSDIDGFCNGGEVPGMVRIGNMTYFQDHKCYDELANGKLKEETLMHKAKVEESWGNATPDGFCNGGEVPGMVRIGNMTYFQDHKCYDELANGKLKEETLMHKAKVEESWGNATPGVMKFYAWLINSFGNFHELDYNVLVKLQECWWKINAHEVTPFTHLESYGQRPYANFKTEKAHDPYLQINSIFGRNYDTSNASNTQDNQGNEERKDDPTLEPSVCKIRRFEMMKYSFNVDEEYIAIKESDYLNHSSTLP
ncbi:hypothetical protein Tco_0012579 [Tanacetum coccineum]